MGAMRLIAVGKHGTTAPMGRSYGTLPPGCVNDGLRHLRVARTKTCLSPSMTDRGK